MADLKAFAEQLVNLTVKEVNELAAILKDEYGIEPAAAGAVMVAGPAAGGDAGDAPAEKTSFDVILKAAGPNKLAVVKLVKDFIKGDDRFVLIDDNEKKLYQAGNFDKVIRYNDKISDNELLIEVDGDDYLPDSKVFERINELYKDKNVWITSAF